MSKHRKLSREQVWESFDRPAAQGVDGLEAADDRRLGRKLWSLAERTLSPDQQTALSRRSAADRSIGEIAKVMGKSQVGVRVSLFRARQTLAKGASAEGWMPVIEVNNISADEDFAGVEAAGGRA